MSGANGSKDSFDLADDAFSSDFFRMYEFKVKRCPQARPHDWTRCPFAHPGEKAKRRDPRKFQYSGTACPEFRKSGACRRGDACPFAHGVFECWCHPSRYRTQICTDGTNCKRRVCFFAHLESEVRKREEPSMQLTGHLQADLAADAQLQQQEVAQAFQVLLNANAQNPGSLANLNLMSSLGMMGQMGQVPMNPLAERAQQLQQQLQQLQALQAIQMPQQQTGYDMNSASLQGALLGQANSGNLQAQIDRELLLSAGQQPSMMASPFARAPAGSAYDARVGTPPLNGHLAHASNLSLSMSLPNPDALRQALGNAGSPLLAPAGSSPAVGDGLLGGTHPSLEALRMQRHGSLDAALPPVAALQAQVQANRTASGTLTSASNLKPSANGHSFARAGSQPVGPVSTAFGISSPGRPPSGRIENSAFGAIGATRPPMQQSALHNLGYHGHRRSIDLGSMSRQVPAHLPSGELSLPDGGASSPLGAQLLSSAGSQPLQRLHGEDSGLAVNMQSSMALDMLQGLSLDGRSGSGWLPPQLGQDISAPLGKHGLSRLGLSSQGSDSLAPGMSLPGQIASATSAAGGSQVSQGAALAAFNLPSGLPPGPSAVALRSSEAQRAYEAFGRPPAIQEGQPLSISSLLAKPLSIGGQEARPTFVGRNASFDNILAELPRSLSEVAMAASAAHYGGEGPMDGSSLDQATDGPNISADGTNLIEHGNLADSAESSA